MPLATSQLPPITFWLREIMGFLPIYKLEH